MLGTVIVREAQFRNVPDLQCAAELAAQEAGRFLQPFLRALDAVIRVQEAVIDPGNAEVPGQIDRRQGDVLQPPEPG